MAVFKHLQVYLMKRDKLCPLSSKETPRDRTQYFLIEKKDEKEAAQNVFLIRDMLTTTEFILFHLLLQLEVLGLSKNSQT